MEHGKLRESIYRGLLLICAVWLAGCGGTPVDADASSCPVPEERQEYIIGPGDTLSVVVWRNEELSATVPVRPDGRVSTPLVEDLQASGKTPSELAADMEAALSEYLRSPQVSVIVTDQGSANQIQVIGEVLNPQSLSYRDGNTLLDVVVAVGGLTDFAAGNRANLIRHVDGGQVECRVRVGDLLDGRMSENIPVYPGDVLIVPETRF